MNPKPLAPSFDDFDFNTLTLVESWPWFHNASVILVGCTIAAMPGLSGLSLSSLPRTPRYFRTNSVSLVANNQGALDDIYAMVVAYIQQLVTNVDALDVVAVPEKTCGFTAISITPQ